MINQPTTGNQPPREKTQSTTPQKAKLNTKTSFVMLRNVFTEQGMR